MRSLKWVDAIMGQNQGHHTIFKVFFITVKNVMTSLTYHNEENHTDRLVFIILARNTFDLFQTTHRIRF